eukprot:jgi/Tetstr1/442344/TSEL_030483.t1
MARYVTWLGNMGTVKASSMQPYMSAVNNFFKDHGREPMAVGDLMGRVRGHYSRVRYVIGVMMQKIKYFGGSAMAAIVVLGYIDPTVCAAVSGSMAPLWMDDPYAAVNKQCCHAKWRFDGKTASPHALRAPSPYTV